jgi:hypothetical protein
MRAVLLFVVAVFLCLSFHSIQVSSASPKYTLCSAKDADVNIQNITANVWPPIKGQTLVLNVTGNNTKEVTSGTYDIKITVGGIPLPDITGNIDVFKPLPWPVGDLQFQYKQDIPSAAPSGNYVIKISAVDQNKHQIFCLSLTFALKAEDEKAVTEEEVSSMSFSSWIEKGKLVRTTKVGKMPALKRFNRRK